MRIPVYRSRAARPSDAPGRPITARMRAEPFIQAELQKGAVLTEVADQVQQYALMRHKSAVEVQLSESLLGAEEEMMNLARDLENSTSIYNVFKPDGSGAWSESVAEMRDRLADNIESRSARNEFIARFNQRELSMRFKLQDQIDARIKARQAAAAAANAKIVEDRLADPFSATIEDYNMAVGIISADQAIGIRNGTTNAVSAGVANAKLAGKIAERATTAFVFDDPTRAVALAEAIDLQDEVASGKMTAQQAYESSNLPAADPAAAYTLHTLQAVPREQALEILYDTIGRSNRIYEARKKEQDRAEAAAKESHDFAYRGMFYFSDQTKQYTARDVIDKAPGAAVMFGLQDNPDAPVTGAEASQMIQTYLNAYNYFTPEQRKQVSAAFDRPRSAFSDKRDENAYADLFRRAQAGNLTIAGLNSLTNFITVNDYTTLLDLMGAKSDEALEDAKSVVRMRFGYDARTAPDTEGARQAEAAYFSVAAQLQQMATQRLSEGNPMTRSEMNQKAKELTEEQLEVFRMALRGDRDQYIEFSMTNIPGIGADNPLADLEAWWSSLSPLEQQQYRNDYARHKLTLMDYQNRMNR